MKRLVGTGNDGTAGGLCAPLQSLLRCKSLNTQVFDVDRYIHGFAKPAITYAPDRRCRKEIEADGNPNIGIVGAEAMGWVERHPSNIVDPSFGPCMPGVLLVLPVGTIHVPADIAGGDLELTAAGDEDVRQVLTDTLTAVESLGRRGRGFRGVGVEAD